MDRLPDGGCFPPEAQILNGVGQFVAVNSLRVGDSVWNPQRGAPVTITKVIVGGEKPGLIRIKTESGVLSVTTQHPVPTTNGVKSAGEVVAGDRIVNGNGEEELVVEAKQLAPEEGLLVTNFETDEDYSDAASGYLLARNAGSDYSSGFVVGDLYRQRELAEKGKR